MDIFGLRDDQDSDSEDSDSSGKEGPSDHATSSCPPSDAKLGLCEDDPNETPPLTSAQQDLHDKEKKVWLIVPFMLSLKNCLSAQRLCLVVAVQKLG